MAAPIDYPECLSSSLPPWPYGVFTTVNVIIIIIFLNPWAIVSGQSCELFLQEFRAPGTELLFPVLIPLIVNIINSILMP